MDSNPNEQCAICFENVVCIEKNNFICEHNNYMHYKCVQLLDKCPLCREPKLEQLQEMIVNEKYYLIVILSIMICILFPMCALCNFNIAVTLTYYILILLLDMVVLEWFIIFHIL